MEWVATGLPCCPQPGLAFSEMPGNEGVPLLIQVASTTRNSVARKEAIFWLGQSDDPRALDFIENILKR